jgi:hypothetical protein
VCSARFRPFGLVAAITTQSVASWLLRALCRRACALPQPALLPPRASALLVGPVRVAPQPPLVASGARHATLGLALAARLPQQLARCSVALRGCVPTLVDVAAITAGSTRRRPTLRSLVPTGCRARVAVAVVRVSGPVRCGEAMHPCLGLPR